MLFDFMTVERHFEDLVFGHDAGHDVLVGVTATDLPTLASDVDRPVTPHQADPSDASFGKREMKPAVRSPIVVEDELRAQPTQLTVQGFKNGSREAGAISAQLQLRMGPAAHEPAFKSKRGPAKRRQRPTGEPAKHSLLPKSIETLHMSLPARLALGDKNHLDSEQQSEANRRRKRLGAAGKSGKSHLVVDLPDLRQTQAFPGTFHQVAAVGIGTAILRLPAGYAASGDINGVVAEEPDGPLAVAR